MEVGEALEERAAAEAAEAPEELGCLMDEVEAMAQMDVTDLMVHKAEVEASQ
jgi:hypothetical protein